MGLLQDNFFSVIARISPCGNYRVIDVYQQVSRLPYNFLSESSGNDEYLATVPIYKFSADFVTKFKVLKLQN